MPLAAAVGSGESIADVEATTRNPVHIGRVAAPTRRGFWIRYERPRPITRAFTAAPGPASPPSTDFATPKSGSHDGRTRTINRTKYDNPRMLPTQSRKMLRIAAMTIIASIGMPGFPKSGRWFEFLYLKCRATPMITPRTSNVRSQLPMFALNRQGGLQRGIRFFGGIIDYSILAIDALHQTSTIYKSGSSMRSVVRGAMQAIFPGAACTSSAFWGMQ